MKKLILLCALLLSAHAFALECDPREWTWARDMALPKVIAKLDELPRDAIVKLAWGEMIRSDASTSMALPILYYLSMTAQNSKLKGYFEVMGFLVTADADPKPLLKIWPKRAPNLQKANLSIANICELYEIAKPKPARWK